MLKESFQAAVQEGETQTDSGGSRSKGNRAGDSGRPSEPEFAGQSSQRTDAKRRRTHIMTPLGICGDFPLNLQLLPDQFVHVLRARGIKTNRKEQL